MEIKIYKTALQDRKQRTIKHNLLVFSVGYANIGMDATSTATFQTSVLVPHLQPIKPMTVVFLHAFLNQCFAMQL